MKKILVTGSNGQLGRALHQLLQNSDADVTYTEKSKILESAVLADKSAYSANSCFFYLDRKSVV